MNCDKNYVFNYNPIDNIENKSELSLVEINDMKWYKNIWKFIKDFFRK